MNNFSRSRSFDSRFNTSLIGLESELDSKQQERLRRFNRNWNFYEGYHWEDLPEQDSVELTVNYCRAFVNKFVAFELGKSFTFSTHATMNNREVTPDNRTTFKFLEDVWVDNDQYLLATEIGQMKSVTGEAWLQIRYFEPDEIDDPFGEYDSGRIRIMLMPSNTVFPEYDPHDKDKLTKVTIMYMYEKTTETRFLRHTKKEQTLYKQIWTKDTCTVIDGKEEPVEYPNKYGVIPFVCIKNFIVAGSTESVSDLEDIIPLNTEYNMKESNISEIIDYHSAPVTIVYGAKIGNLEKGANKLWGGLAKDAKVENLHLDSDLGASYNYAQGLRLAMCEVGGIPEASLGGSQSISNTSGVALQYINMPLIEKTRVKRTSTENGLERVNKIILLVALSEGLITKPEDVPNRYFFFNEVELPDTLPKDELLELQQIQIEMQLGIEYREGALKRLGRENIQEYLGKVDADREAHPEFYVSSSKKDTPELNSGMTNGQTPQETLNNELNGQNKEE